MPVTFDWLQSRVGTCLPSCVRACVRVGVGGVWVWVWVSVHVTGVQRSNRERPATDDLRDFEYVSMESA